MSLAQHVFTNEKYTVADIVNMQDAGLIDATDRFELIDGEIVPMNAQHDPHELIKSELSIAIGAARPPDLRIGLASSIYLSSDTFLEPDICLFPRNIPLMDVKGQDLIIAIEISGSTLAFDRGRKARLYARYGVREYWVIDAVKRRTFIHLGPSGEGWASITEQGPEFELTISALPGFRQRLDAI